jgi:5-(carboxyamino)imidazole ribonucleotide synthase
VLSRPFDSDEGLAMLAACDVVTYEFENVPVSATQKLSLEVPVFPPPQALQYAQDRMKEKQLFDTLEIPVPAWRAVSSPEDLEEAIAAIGLPLMLKTRRLGYDGKGQAVIQSQQEAAALWSEAGDRSLIAEQWIPFEREISMFGARSKDGETVIYPMTQNEHRQGILRVSKAPADGAAVASEAARYLQKLLTHLDYVGVLALEAFVTGDRLLANEFAPRVHNSGHWTIEGSRTSQFENHLRAIVDLPLGDTSAVGYAGMLNLIGSLPANTAKFNVPGLHLHEYGKAPRPGRKLGHITVIAPDAATRDQALSKALKVLGN